MELTLALRGTVSFTWGYTEGAWMSKENWSSVGKEEGRYGCWLGIWIKSLQSISLTIIILTITLFIISFCFGLLALPVSLPVLRVMSLILAFSVSAGLSLVPASSNERSTKMYHFYFQLLFPSQKYLKPNTPGVQSYSKQAKGLISRSQQLSQQWVV